MNNVNQTLYIPLYGKAYVSKKELFLKDPKAEQIWEAEGFALKGKSRSRWLAYYMGIRAAVFDAWVKQQLKTCPGAVVVHMGCGMDSRVLRVGTMGSKWYDVDFPEVIREREKYYTRTAEYQMLAGDLRDSGWLEQIPEKESAIVIMEGVSMYLTPEQLRELTENLNNHFDRIAFLMDCYTPKAAKLSQYKNPINDVGVTKVYGMDDPTMLQRNDFLYVREHPMTPQNYIDELQGLEKYIFAKLYAGGFSSKLYRLFEYQKG